MEEAKIEEFLQRTFKAKYKIIKPTFSPLIKPGESCLSAMLKVDLKLKKDYGSPEEILHAVVKCANMNTSSLFASQIFPMAFKNEINFYKEVVPALQNFQRERGLDDVMNFFPEFYGARLNKNGGDVVDENVVLVLENLNFRGYQNLDRYLGFDLDGAKLILKDLATLHATALALKFAKREEFEEKIKRYCQKAIPPPPPEGKNTNKYKQKLEVIFEVLEDYKECRPYLASLKEKFSKMREKLIEFFDIPPREPFATLVHCDLWVNNTMQIIENGKLTKNKFIDFQLFFYQSPAADLLFFLWSSVQTEILRNNFEELLEYYHEEFSECLRKLNCNTKLFTFDKFLEEMDLAAPSNFMHTMYTTMFIVFGKKYQKDSDVVDRVNILKEDIPIIARDKISYMVYEYGRRGWI